LQDRPAKSSPGHGQQLQRNVPYGTPEAVPDHSIIRGFHTASGRELPFRDLLLNGGYLAF
ncbi:hypothetical protein, partial [Devosia sp. 1635]|uniref:hypothetical protein n=1 Tax=Devosia sp. 1635 TaxID=2726066 RepID=UPI001AED24D9